MTSFFFTDLEIRGKQRKAIEIKPMQIPIQLDWNFRFYWLTLAYILRSDHSLEEYFALELT